MAKSLGRPHLISVGVLGQTVGAAVAAVAVTLLAGRAEAQLSPMRQTPPPRVFPEAEIDLFAKRYFTLPAPTLLPPSSQGDVRFTGRPAAIGEGLTLAGVGAGFGLAFDDRWLMPVMRAEFATAIGRSPRVLSGVDGSIAEIRPWTAKNLAVHFFGFGVRTKHRRWMFEASAMPGVAITWMDAAVASGDGSIDTTALLISLSLRGELVGCRRLDPESRVCLSVAPMIYEHGFFNGGSLGLRWEIGP